MSRVVLIPLAALAIAGCPAVSQPPQEAVVRSQAGVKVSVPKAASATPVSTVSLTPGLPSARPSAGNPFNGGGFIDQSPSPSASTSASAVPTAVPSAKGSFDPTATGVVVTYAGTGAVGAGNGTGLAASFNTPEGLAVDTAGMVYVSEYAAHRLRQISLKREVTTLAGSGASGYNDGAPAMARFNNPLGLAVDGAGTTLEVADYYNNRIRQLTKDAASGAWMVDTLAGSSAGGLADGKGTAAQLWYPTAMTFDADGNGYVADSYNNCVRKITPAGLVTTLPPKDLQHPGGIAIDGKGRLFVADTGNHRIVKLELNGATWQQSVVAGTGAAGYVDKTGLQSQFSEPRGLAIAQDGTLYVADSNNHCIRKLVTDERGLVTVSTLAGTNTPGYVDGAPSQARFNTPMALALDAKGRLYVADAKNHAIRRIQ